MLQCSKLWVLSLLWFRAQEIPNRIKILNVEPRFRRLLAWPIFSTKSYLWWLSNRPTSRQRLEACGQKSPFLSVDKNGRMIAGFWRVLYVLAYQGSRLKPTQIAPLLSPLPDIETEFLKLRDLLQEVLVCQGCGEFWLLVTYIMYWMIIEGLWILI